MNAAKQTAPAQLSYFETILEQIAENASEQEDVRDQMTRLQERLDNLNQRYVKLRSDEVWMAEDTCCTKALHEGDNCDENECPNQHRGLVEDDEVSVHDTKHRWVNRDY